MKKLKVNTSFEIEYIPYDTKAKNDELKKQVKRHIEWLLRSEADYIDVQVEEDRETGCFFEDATGKTKNIKVTVK